MAIRSVDDPCSSPTKAQDVPAIDGTETRPAAASPRRDPSGSTDEEDLDDVVGPLLKYSLGLASAEPPSAPIKMPEKDALTVRLVPIHQLQRFDELRDDASLWQSIAWTAGGGLLGFVTNFLTAQAAPTDIATYMVVGLLCLVAVGAGRKHASVSRRLDHLRQKLFET